MIHNGMNGIMCEYCGDDKTQVVKRVLRGHSFWFSVKDTTTIVTKK